MGSRRLGYGAGFALAGTSGFADESLQADLATFSGGACVLCGADSDRDPLAGPAANRRLATAIQLLGGEASAVWRRDGVVGEPEADLPAFAAGSYDDLCDLALDAIYEYRFGRRVPEPDQAASRVCGDPGGS